MSKLPGFKSLGALIVAALGVGRAMQHARLMHRAVTTKSPRSNKFVPHQGPREIARRKSQIERGIIHPN